MANVMYRFSNGYDIIQDNDGYGPIYIPRESGVQWTHTDRDYAVTIKTFKTLKGAINFLKKQGAVETAQDTLPEQAEAQVQESPAPEPTFQIGNIVTIDLYGERLGKIVSIHDPGDGYGPSLEVELDEAWRGGKKLWFEAKDVRSDL